MSSDIWDHWNEQYGTKYPNENVVQFCFGKFSPEERCRVRALDLGCGSGVHTAFLASEGFQVTAVDISPVGIANTKRRLSALGTEAVLCVESIDSLTFLPNSFDLVICVGVFESTGPDLAIASINHLVNIMANGGCGFFMFASDRDYAVRVDNLWKMHGYKRNEVETIFSSKFRHVWIDRCISTHDGGKFEQNEWIVTVEK